MTNDHGLVAVYADLHNHCAISYGHGELIDALKNAALRLDFVSITGHADWPDMPTDDPRISSRSTRRGSRSSSRSGTGTSSNSRSLRRRVVS